MESLDIKQIQQSIQAVTPNRINQPKSLNEDNEEKKVIEQTTAEKEALNKAVYGDVLDVSEDGDTVSARPESIRASEDGYVFIKEEQAKEQEAEEVNEESQYNSLNGLSEQQVETLYRQGKISNNQYRNEMERRTNLKEQMKLSSLGEESDKEEIENEALQTALKNNRGELMMDVFASQMQQQ